MLERCTLRDWQRPQCLTGCRMCSILHRRIMPKRELNRFFACRRRLCGSCDLTRGSKRRAISSTPPVALHAVLQRKKIAHRLTRTGRIVRRDKVKAALRGHRVSGAKAGISPRVIAKIEMANPAAVPRSPVIVTNMPDGPELGGALSTTSVAPPSSTSRKANNAFRWTRLSAGVSETRCGCNCSALAYNLANLLGRCIAYARAMATGPWLEPLSTESCQMGARVVRHRPRQSTFQLAEGRSQAHGQGHPQLRSHRLRSASVMCVTAIADRN